jgi:hypothetical protein
MRYTLFVGLKYVLQMSGTDWPKSLTYVIPHTEYTIYIYGKTISV